MKHLVRHDLSPEDARRAVTAAISAYQARFAEFNPTAEWRNEDEAEIAFSAKGVKLKGILALTAQGIELDLDVPFVFRFVQKRAVAVIDEEVTRWVEKVRRGEI